MSIDARNLPSQLKRFPELLEEVRARHIQCDVLYLDADDETLLKRFSETRRRHPLTNESRSLAGRFVTRSCCWRQSSIMPT